MTYMLLLNCALNLVEEINVQGNLGGKINIVGGYNVGKREHSLYEHAYN